MREQAVKAFLSYSHDSKEHSKRVLELANRLRLDGIDASCDQYEASVPEGWPRWMERELQDAHYVLVVCTETYLSRFEGREQPGQGLGVRWESKLTRQEIYEANSLNHKYIPVSFEDTSDFIPRPLRDSTPYFLSTPEGYERLLKRLRGEGAAARPPLGSRPPDQNRTMGWQPSSEALAKAVAEYKAARARDPGIGKLDLRALAGINRGPHETELDLLDYAVAPSLRGETEKDKQREVELWSKLKERELDPAERHEITRELKKLEHARWNYHEGRRSPLGELSSFASALHRHRALMVIGEPGAGKSVLTRLAFLACDEGEMGERARTLLLDDAWYDRPAVETIEALRGLLPVHFTLSAFGHVLMREELSFEEFLHRQLRHQGASEALLAGLGGLLAHGQIFVLCDALDEASGSQRWRVVERVSEFVLRHPQVRLLMTSRPQGYHPRARGLEHTRLAPLHERQQRALVLRLHYLMETHRQADARSVERAHRRTNALLRAIGTQGEWAELSSNPLLLTLSALTPTDEDAAPRHRVFVFENFIRTLSGEWRATLSLSPHEAIQLIAVWSAVASKLLLREEGHGIAREPFLRLLAEALQERREPVPLEAEKLLQLALETGLVRMLEDETVVFWHKTFAEFLAARALTGDGLGAAKQLMAEDSLPPLVLRLAAARLYHVLKLYSELDALAEGLLARDEQGAGRLLRSGLRGVSACLAEGVLFSSALNERVWRTWAEVLEQTPPSPLWSDFAQLTGNALPRRLPAALLERFALVPDHRVAEVQDVLARIVAPSAAVSPVAREACRRWVQQSSGSTAKLHGAFGLASAGEWSDAIIDGLGRFSTSQTLDGGAVGELVRRGGTPVVEQLRALVRMPLPSNGASSATGPGTSPQAPVLNEQDEKALRSRQLSAAILLAAAGGWDDDVARVMALSIEGRHSSQRERETVDVVRAHSRDKAVQGSLLEWMAQSSTVGSKAREILRNVAASIEGLPEQILERTASAESRVRDELESMLVAIGKEQRVLTDALWCWLEAEPLERSLCAARILCRLEPCHDRLHEALRTGMRAPNTIARARWAHQSLGLKRSLDEAAMETLLDCARSVEPEVRAAVYAELYQLFWRWKWGSIDPWLASAADPQVPVRARLDMISLLEHSPRRMEVVPPLMRELLDSEDSEVRRRAALWLLEEDQIDERTVVIAAEEAARINDNRRFSVRLLAKAKPFAAAVLKAVMRGLPDAPSPAAAEPPLPWHEWGSLLMELALEDGSCVGVLLDALDHPGWPGLIAEAALDLLGKEQVSLYAALRERLEGTHEGSPQLALLRLVWLGLKFDETRRSAIEASQHIDLRGLTQSQLEQLAQRLHTGHAPNHAGRLWRLVLEGEDLELVLRAAEALVVRFPEDIRAWLQPTIARLLASPNLSYRVDAARIALRCHFLEEQAEETLLSCLDLAASAYKRGVEHSWLGRSSDSHAIANGSTDINPLEDQLLSWGTEPRLDIEAMYALCTYRPEVGFARLTAWLYDPDMHRFVGAVRACANREREAVRGALMHRLRSGPTHQLDSVIHWVEECGLYSMEMAEQLLARVTPELPLYDHIEQCLARWWHLKPEFWAVLRRQPLERRAELARMLQYRLPITRDAVAFVVERALSAFTGDLLVTGSPLEYWCRAPRPEEAQRERPQWEHPRPPPEVVRGWLREVLAEQERPTSLFNLLRFDSFAELAELPPERRIENLWHALTLEEGPEENSRTMLMRQAEAALQLHGIQGRDERLVHILEKLVLALARESLAQHFQFELWGALLTLRSKDSKLRSLFLRWVVAMDWTVPIERIRGLLTLLGLSSEEIIDVLLVYLDIAPVAPWLEALITPQEQLAPRPVSEQRWLIVPELFDTIEELGCPTERRSALLHEWVSKHGRSLSSPTQRQLATRSDLSRIDAAKLLLTAIAQPGWGAREAEEQWIKDFAQERAKEENDRWWHYGDSHGLASRLRALVKLSRVKEPDVVEAAVVELASVPGDRFLPLYRQLRAGSALSDSEWREILGSLTVTAGEDALILLTREWLTLGLWQTVEPSTRSAWASSDV